MRKWQSRIIQDVRKVSKKSVINEPSGHSVPRKDIPNSVTQTFDKDGNLVKERYYGNDGKADFDIDYTNHGNEKKHPKVPHIRTNGTGQIPIIQKEGKQNDKKTA